MTAVVVALVVPPSLSAKVTVMEYNPPAAYAWLPLNEPEPPASSITAAPVVPSPQLMVAVWVSSTPASVNVPARVTVCPSPAAPGVVALVESAVITGGAFSTVTETVASFERTPLSSLTS